MSREPVGVQLAAREERGLQPGSGAEQMEAGWRGRDFGAQLERGEPSPEGGMGSIWGVRSRTPSEVLEEW